MKKIILTISIFLFFGGLILAQENNQDNPVSLSSQNKIRSCLKAEIQGQRGTSGCKYFDSSVHLTGFCYAPNGCKIYQEHLPGEHCEIKDSPPNREVEDSYFNSGKNDFPYGPIDTTIKGEFQAHTQYLWYAEGDAQSTGQGIDVENKTQQVGREANFSEFKNEKCVGIHWDPFGRVFDAVSLEPISEVEVSLYEAANKKLATSSINNPTKTDERGVYNIFVGKESDYYFDVKPPNTHLFTANINLNENYNKIYLNIYKPGDIFHEAPLPNYVPPNFDWSSYHHDIPLQPKNIPYRKAIAEVLTNSLNQIDLGNKVSFSGMVTFPMAKVCLIGETVGEISCSNADRFGVFEIVLDRSSIPQEFIEVKAEKVDLTKL